MSNTLSYIIQINENFDKVNSSFNKFQNNVHTGIDKVQKQLNGLRLNNLIQNISSAADGLISLNDPGIKLSSSLADLSAITGTTGAKLKEIEGYARENANTFGGSAAESTESYKLILSKLTPEIAKVPSALKAMGKEASITSKLMGGDTVAATEVLTTAMNQYQVSMKDPIQAAKEMAKMNNVMAASAKEGSAELPQIAQALEQSGLAAKTANVSFEETNAFIQVLDKNGKKGAEGGVALRNVMATLSEGRFLPKDTKKALTDAGVDINKLTDNSVSLSERLKPLKGIMNDQALVTKLFGKENSNAAIAMVAGIGEAERLTKAVTGTNTAYEQAAIIMESPLEKNKRLQAQIDDFKITLFNGTNGWLGYANVIGNTTRDFSNLMPIFQGAGTVFSTLTSATKMQALWTGVVTKAQWLWNAAMTANPIGLIIAGVALLIGYITAAVTHFDSFGASMTLLLGPVGLVVSAFMALKDHWDSITAAFSSGGIIAGFKRIGIVLLDTVLKPVQQLLELIAKIPGMGNLAGSGAKAIKDLRLKMDLVTPGEKIKPKSDKAGITAASIPGADFGKGGAAGAGGSGASAKKSNEAVATGGTKHNYITISIKELNGLKDVVISGKDAASKAGSEVADELLRVLAMASTATG